ncbi:MAG: RNA-protein complex protein Nop10 [Candidatus Korarchaeota archaeon]
MRFKMKRCPKCWNYTFAELCPYCGAQTQSPHPPRFSPADKWGEYRRRAKLQMESSDNKNEK